MKLILQVECFVWKSSERENTHGCRAGDWSKRHSGEKCVIMDAMKNGASSWYAIQIVYKVPGWVIDRMFAFHRLNSSDVTLFHGFRNEIYRCGNFKVTPRIIYDTSIDWLHSLFSLLVLCKSAFFFFFNTYFYVRMCRSIVYMRIFDLKQANLYTVS